MTRPQSEDRHLPPNGTFQTEESEDVLDNQRDWSDTVGHTGQNAGKTEKDDNIAAFAERWRDPQLSEEGVPKTYKYAAPSGDEMHENYEKYHESRLSGDDSS